MGWGAKGWKCPLGEISTPCRLQRDIKDKCTRGWRWGDGNIKHNRDFSPTQTKLSLACRNGIEKGRCCGSG